MVIRRLLACLAAGAVLVPAAAARAQTSGCGCVLDRFVAPVPGAGFFAADSLEGLHGHLRPGAGATASMGYKPLVITEADGAERTAVVSAQLTLTPAGSLVLWNRLRLAGSVPIVVVQDGNEGKLAGLTYVAPDRGPLLGDVRARADLRAYGDPQGPFRIAASAVAVLPVGSPETYSGRGSTRVVGEVNAAGRIGRLVYAARLSPTIDTRESAASSLGFGVVAGYRPNARWTFAVESYGSTLLRDGDTVLREDSTAVECLAAVHHASSTVRWHLGVGPGSRAPGSPVVRLAFGIDWSAEPAAPRRLPPAPPPQQPTPPSRAPEPRPDLPVDGDEDGITDDVDACPTAPGAPSEDPKLHGCPVVELLADRIKLLRPLAFRFGSAELVDREDPVLVGAKEALDERPDHIVHVEGHSDNLGSRAFNLELSKKRAATVKAWLTQHGVEERRITSDGFGPDRPIADNATEEGRAINRRVELLLEKPGVP